MPKTAFQKHFFALATVVITVAAFILYSLFIVNADDLMAAAGASTVWQAVSTHGVWMLGRSHSIWLMAAVEIVLAFLLETFIAGPLATRYALHQASPEKNAVIVFNTVLSGATVAMMCPMMTFIATFLYFPAGEAMTGYNVAVEFFHLLCVNFPFALMGQLFFIQPLVRTIFRLVFERGENPVQEQKQLLSAETAE